ncbi:MAG: hypothetical protein U9Q66_04045 [Patescibacteria group bacterium]|nr:hypothetical protein [Patescibacteria group bacterium]
MNLFIVLFVVTVSSVGLFYYISWHKYLFLKHEEVVHDGIGKYFVKAKKHEHYVQSIKDEECLYYSLIVGSSGSMNNLYDIFSTDNSFLLEVEDKTLFIDSATVKFDLQRRFLTFVVVPSMMKRFLTKSPTKDEYIEFFHNHSVSDAPNKRAYSYYDISVYEDMKYTLIAKFKNGVLDTSFKPIILDNDKRGIREVLVTAILIIVPAIVSIFVFIYKF